ncbi:Protein FAM114A2 [Camponotus floridanus]|uniref:Protein FAM114A2 n=1 Tax=Camponotus floridanus TaxID=104421 RepID=E2ADP0_CAMFO|nr:protein FAM114A2 isoform X1 [Camponotus floridanus]EFN68402.1 Protein FAM114A2 [Camponotus floridanus]
MVTSDSDTDFESADEELDRNRPPKKDSRVTYWTSSTVDSESDDDAEYFQRPLYKSSNWQRRKTARSNVTTGQETLVSDKDDKIAGNVKGDDNVHMVKSIETFNNQEDTSPIELKKSLCLTSSISVKDKNAQFMADDSLIVKSDDTMSKMEAKAEKTSEITQQRNSSHQLGTKKLATKITKDSNEESTECLNKKSLQSTCKDTKCELQKNNQSTDDECKPTGTNDLSEMDMPEELKSNKKFKEVFQPEGWEGLENDIELPDELMEEKLEPVLERLSVANKEPESPLGNWSSWGNWDVTTLLNTATASVSTLTTRVSQGLTLLEDTIGIQDSRELAEIKQDETAVLDDADSETREKENQSYSTFGFGNLISGVSSITKLVESTGKEFTSKVMTGGLDTLEAIGKKTMEVLQDGDPGLKKKRAFFMNEPEKPNLSQILREAKEKAEIEQKTIEERQLARKVHFESLFDDYQGLVHLEALEILSKQSSMKIQQYLIELDANELTSVQETLEEIKQLCNLNDIDDEDNKNNKDLKDKLESACHDLGVDITYEKLYNVWIETKSYLTSSLTDTDQEIFQNAISTLAQFTAFSIERFHKTAELLLIKERRSTVNEADALVQLTNILSDQINLLANSFYDTLRQLAETVEKPNNIEANLERISSEACNANSYIQDAFKLLIPILQVGAI